MKETVPSEALLINTIKLNLESAKRNLKTCAGIYALSSKVPSNSFTLKPPEVYLFGHTEADIKTFP